MDHSDLSIAVTILLAAIGLQVAIDDETRRWRTPGWH